MPAGRWPSGPPFRYKSSSSLKRADGPIGCCPTVRFDCRRVKPVPDRSSEVSAVDHGEVESGDAFGVGEEVDLDDPSVLDRKGADGERPAVAHRDSARGAVDQRTPDGQVDPRPHDGLAGDLFTPLTLVRPRAQPHT